VRFTFGVSVALRVPGERVCALPQPWHGATEGHDKGVEGGIVPHLGLGHIVTLHDRG
jgi:hypothetical protein